MGKTQIIIAGILFFSLAITAFLLTLIEFVNMDKNPDKYKNPRYKKKSTRKASSKKAATKTASKKTNTAAKKASGTKKSTAKTTSKKRTVAAKKATPTKKTATRKTYGVGRLVGRLVGGCA